jgi:hypothetical protein
MREVRVSGVSLDPVSNTPIIILRDRETERVIPIWIGLLEAPSITTELEAIRLPRPMTHDLLKSILEKLHVRVAKVEVDGLRNSTFYATIYLKGEGLDVSIDARPSDAIAIALRTGSPIYVAEQIIEASDRIDLTTLETEEKDISAKDWNEVLEEMTPEDFGKFRM